MKMNKKQKVNLARRKQIVKTALKLFVEDSYSKTSVDDICKELKISHGLFYHYFKDKEDLLNRMIKLFYDEIKLDYSEFKDVNAKDKLYLVTERIISFISKDKYNTYKFYLALSIFNDEKAKEIFTKMKEENNYPSFFSCFVHLFEELEKSDYLRFDKEKSLETYIFYIVGLLHAYIEKGNNTFEMKKEPEKTFICDLLLK